MVSIKIRVMGPYKCLCSTVRGPLPIHNLLPAATYQVKYQEMKPTVYSAGHGQMVGHLRMGQIGDSNLA